MIKRDFYARKKSTRMGREHMQAARWILRDPEYLGLKYFGRTRKGRFYVPVDRCAIGKKLIQYWGDDVTPEKISRVITLLRKACKLEGVTGDERSQYLNRVKRIDSLLME